MTSTEPNSPPTVEKKATLPPGILPRNTQVWFIGGLALLMVLVIWFSDGSAPKPKPAKDRLAPPAAVDPSQARIQEYRTRIEEQTRKLAAEQAQLGQAKQAVLGDASPRGNGDSLRRPVYESHPPATYPTPAPERSWIDQDREKREYQSRYASNLALSFRAAAGVDAEPETGKRPRPVLRATNARPKSEPAETGEAAVVNGEPDAKAPADKKKRSHDDINKAEGKEYRLYEGTVLETVLTNRLDGAFSGPVNCMVTTNVFSHNRQHVLIPQGSRAQGEVKRVEALGQRRLAVVFHRLVMPDGYSVSLDQFRGLNQVGETGLRDKVNHHYLQIFGVSLAIGAIAGLSQVNSRSGFDASAEDAYRQGVASSLSQSSLRILDRYLNVLPTITIREGHRVKIYLSDDLLLPTYENHRMPDDI